MPDKVTSSPAARVVAWMRAPMAAPAPDGWVHVPTAYEAVAELLAAPTDVLVVDLHLVAGRRVLEIARDLDVKTVGFGAAGDPPVDGLLHIRMASPEGLADVVAGAVKAPAAPPPEPHAAPTVRLTPARQHRQAESDREEREEAAFEEVARAADEVLESGEPARPKAAAAVAPGRQASIDARKPARDEPSLSGPGPLTDDELEALLENES